MSAASGTARTHLSRTVDSTNRATTRVPTRVVRLQPGQPKSDTGQSQSTTRAEPRDGGTNPSFRIRYSEFVSDVFPEPLRKKLRRREGGIRFITFSCQRRLPLLGKPGARNVFVDSLYAARAKFGFPLYAWVVMPEHVHLMMMATEEAPLPRILQFGVCYEFNLLQLRFFSVFSEAATPSAPRQLFAPPLPLRRRSLPQ